MARRLQRSPDGFNVHVGRSIRRCREYCPTCKRQCLGTDTHIRDGESAIMAHQCERHWWLAVKTDCNRIIKIGGEMNEEKEKSKRF